MKWYTFNDTEEKSTVDLILDHNTTATTSWNSSGTSKDGPMNVEEYVLHQLYADTDTWSNELNRTDSYQSITQNGYRNYTIDYSGHKARLISVEEITKITGNINFNILSANSWLYLDTYNQTTPSARNFS